MTELREIIQKLENTKHEALCSYIKGLGFVLRGNVEFSKRAGRFKTTEIATTTDETNFVASTIQVDLVHETKKFS